jgi:GntR family transcriptional regulator
MQKSEPLYKVVKHRISECLGEGKWKHGQAIPSEPLLAMRFGASIGTVRTAVDELVAENILVRQQGRGTFVTSFTRDYMLNVFFAIADKKSKAKELPQTEMLSFRRGRADLSAAKELGLAKGAAVFEIENLLRLSGDPVIVDHLRLPVSLFSDLSDRIFQNRESTIYGFYQSRYGITVVRTEEMISAVTADDKIRHLLKIKGDPAVLKIIRTAYTLRDVAVDTRIRYVKTTRHGYMSVIGKR